MACQACEVCPRPSDPRVLPPPQHSVPPTLPSFCSSTGHTHSHLVLSGFAVSLPGMFFPDLHKVCSQTSFRSLIRETFLEANLYSSP